jgi:hypothetical protein
LFDTYCHVQRVWGRWHDTLSWEATRFKQKMFHILLRRIIICARWVLPDTRFAERQGYIFNRTTLVATYFNMQSPQGDLSWLKDSSEKPRKRRNPRSSRLPRSAAIPE